MPGDDEEMPIVSEGEQELEGMTDENGEKIKIDMSMWDEGADPRPMYKEVSTGSCPNHGHFPNRLTDFDFKKLEGAWIRIVDEKAWIGNYTCPGSIFVPTHFNPKGNNGRAFWGSSEKFTENHIEMHLEINPDFDDTAEYMVSPDQ